VLPVLSTVGLHETFYVHFFAGEFFTIQSSCQRISATTILSVGLRLKTFYKGTKNPGIGLAEPMYAYRQKLLLTAATAVCVSSKAKRNGYKKTHLRYRPTNNLLGNCVYIQTVQINDEILLEKDASFCKKYNYSIIGKRTLYLFIQQF